MKFCTFACARVSHLPGRVKVDVGSLERNERNGRTVVEFDRVRVGLDRWLDDVPALPVRTKRVRAERRRVAVSCLVPESVIDDVPVAPLVDPHEGVFNIGQQTGIPSDWCDACVSVDVM